MLRSEEAVRLESPDYLTTVVATLTGDSFLVRVAKAAGLLNDPSFIPPRPESPIRTPKLQSHAGVVSASVRKPRVSSMSPLRIPIRSGRS